MHNENELKKLLAGDIKQSSGSDRINRGLRRTRENLSQQHALGFILIKLWVVIAKVLAPFFAGLAKRQAQELSRKNKIENPQSTELSQRRET